MAEVLTHTLGGSVVCAVNVVPNLPPLFADRGQLETVLVNLATNARDAMPSGGTLTLGADAEMVSAGLPHPAGLAPGLYIRIEVSDTGTGMDRGVLSRVTEPFFTTKEPGKGTGLGLAMAKGFVEQSGGSLSIDSAPGQGTRVILWLPAATVAEPCRGGERRRGARVRHGKPCVLLVDDDAIVRDVLTLSLEDAGYTRTRRRRRRRGPGLARAGRAGGYHRLRPDDAGDGRADADPRWCRSAGPNLPAMLLTGYAGDGAALAVGGAISGIVFAAAQAGVRTQLVDRINALAGVAEAAEQASDSRPGDQDWIEARLSAPSGPRFSSYAGTLELKPRKPALGSGVPPSLANSFGRRDRLRRHRQPAAVTRLADGLPRLAALRVGAVAFAGRRLPPVHRGATARDPRPLSSPRIDSSRNEMSLRPRSTDSSIGVMPRTLTPFRSAPRFSASARRGDVAAVDRIEQRIGRLHVAGDMGRRCGRVRGLGAGNRVRRRQRPVCRCSRDCTCWSGAAATWPVGLLNRCCARPPRRNRRDSQHQAPTPKIDTRARTSALDQTVMASS